MRLGDAVQCTVTLKKVEMRCEACGGRMTVHGYKDRKISHPALTEHKLVLIHHARRFICTQCHATAMEPNPFAFEGFRSSYLLMRKVMERLSNLNYTLDMISRELHISTTQITRYLDSYVTVPPVRLPEWICIDELHSPSLSSRNASYLCVLADGSRRCLLDVFPSRSKAYLSNRFTAYPLEKRRCVKYVTIDMYRPYLDVARECFPECIVAVDPFHVVKHLMDGFGKLRISLMNRCEYGSNGYYLLKKWHWLLESDGVNLDNEPVWNSRFGRKLNRRDIENMILESFPILEKAWVLKERYRRMNMECSYGEACAEFDGLLDDFRNSGIREYEEFTQILSTWKEEILNSFMRPYGKAKLSNALCENLNGKIGDYIRISKGVTNFQRFRKRVLFALSEDVFYSISTSLASLKKPGKKRGAYGGKKDLK